MRAFGCGQRRACLPVACSSTGCNVLPIYMEVQQVRLPMVLLAFCLSFAFWTAAFFLHLRGGLTTYSLLVISLTLLSQDASRDRWGLKREPRFHLNYLCIEVEPSSTR